MQSKQPQASRRGFFLAATAAGSALASVGWLRTTQGSVVASELPRPTAVGGGYVLSDHVKQYYQTTRV